MNLRAPTEGPITDVVETWKCDRCGLIMLALSRSLHEALHEHVQPTTPKPPDPRLDRVLEHLGNIIDRLNQVEWDLTHLRNAVGDPPGRSGGR